MLLNNKFKFKNILAFYQIFYLFFSPATLPWICGSMIIQSNSYLKQYYVAENVD